MHRFISALHYPTILLTHRAVFREQNGIYAEIDQVNALLSNLGSGFDVVNLSLQADRAIDRVADILKRKATLVVVAAGNGDHTDTGRRISASSGRFPARYGGRGHGEWPILVVAATQTVAGQQTLVRFSDFGADTVDLAAPGCRVPVLTLDPQSDRWFESRASGTSFAAPLVSFTAAMLAREMRLAFDEQNHDRSQAFGIALMRRVLVAADMTAPPTPKPSCPAEQPPENQPPMPLFCAVADGRVLNPVRTLAIYDDVVTIPDATAGRVGTGRLVLGEAILVAEGDRPVQDDQTLDLECENFSTGVPLSRVLKITPQFQRNSNYSTRVYLRDTTSTLGLDKLFDAYDCRLPDRLRLRMTNHYSVDGFPVTETEWNLSDVLDFVPRMRSARVDQ